LFHGLVTKSAAPAFIPSTARAIEPQAVMSTMGSEGRKALISLSRRRPSSPEVRREKFMSWSTSRHSWPRSHSRASAGVSVACEASPACFSSRVSEAVTEGSSSTTRIIRASDLAPVGVAPYS